MGAEKVKDNEFLKLTMNKNMNYLEQTRQRFDNNYMSGW